MTPEQRRALRLLAEAGQRGITVALMLAHGFAAEMLTGLVRAKLAKRCRVTVKAGARTIGVTYMIITAAARKAIRTAMRRR